MNALVSFFLIYQIAESSQREQHLGSSYTAGIFGTLFDEGHDMALALVFVQLVDIDEDAGLLYLAKLVVDGGAQDEHRGGEIHIGIDEWGNIAATLAHLGIEDAVVELEVALGEELAELAGIMLDEQGVIGAHHVSTVAKVLAEEVEYHIARQAVVRGIHGHLTEEVLGIGEYYSEGSKAIEEVVESKKSLGVAARGLILDGHKRAAQLESARQIVLYELLGEVKHVGGSQNGLPLGIELYIGTMDIAVATDNLLGIGVPHDELLVGALHGIKLVDIGTKACAATSGTEGYLAQAPYLEHYVGGVVGIDDVEVVATTVGVAKAALLGELGLEQGFADGVYYLLHSRWHVG